MNYIEEHVDFIERYKQVNETVDFLVDHDLRIEENELSKREINKHVRNMCKNYKRAIKKLKELRKDIRKVKGQKLFSEYEIFMNIIWDNIDWLKLIITGCKTGELAAYDKATEIRIKSIRVFEKMLERMKKIIKEDKDFDKNTKQKIIKDKLFEIGYERAANTLKTYE